MSEKRLIIRTLWRAMNARCNNPKKCDFYRYGGRGIKIDTNWSSFINFWNDMNAGWKKGLTLDRIDNNDNYSKNNCRWASRKVQAINRRNTRFFQYKGKKLTLTDWSPIVNIARSTLAQRYYGYKWSVEKTLSTLV